MFGYSVPSVINHSIYVEDDVNAPAGTFVTFVPSAYALNGASLGSGGIGVRGHTLDGIGVQGYSQGAGTAVHGQAIADDSTAVYANSEGANGIGMLCSASQSTSAAVAIRGKIRADQASTHTLGTYSGKAVPLYDYSGVLIGYIPLYA